MQHFPMRSNIYSMNVEPTPPPVIRPIDILSGLGLLERAEMCQIIAMIECVDGLFLSGVLRIVLAPNSVLQRMSRQSVSNSSE